MYIIYVYMYTYGERERAHLVGGLNGAGALAQPGGQLDGHQPLLLAHLECQTFTYMDFVETCFYGDSYRGISPIRSSPPLLGPPYDSRYSPSAGC